MNEEQKAAAPNARPSPGYYLGLVLVSGAMIILPILYAALTAACCWAVYYFATHQFAAIWLWPVGYSYYGAMVKVLASVTPLLVGGAVALAMVKPFFARRQRHMQPLGLDPSVEPQVYALVGRICGLVGAPAPTRIEVNCDINASAGFDRGGAGIFRHKMVLTLGMPLVAGLTERELAGVIAHEFGHFRQPVALRLSSVIRRVNHWFARVVYERDGWDETLESACASAEGWMALMLGTVKAGVAASRGVLWLFMMTGHGFSGYLLRQMEYDADRWETYVVGAATFESTTLKLSTMNSVLAEIHREMRRSWRSHFQLPDNLPVLLEYRISHFPESKRAKAENAATVEKGSWFATHPTAGQRVRRARRAGWTGVIEGDRPARELFENFESISKLVTLAHYEDDLSVPAEPDFLIPLEKLVRASESPEPAARPAPIPMMAYNPPPPRKPENEL